MSSALPLFRHSRRRIVVAPFLKHGSLNTNPPLWNTEFYRAFQCKVHLGFQQSDDIFLLLFFQWLCAPYIERRWAILQSWAGKSQQDHSVRLEFSSDLVGTKVCESFPRFVCSEIHQKIWSCISFIFTAVEYSCIVVRILFLLSVLMPLFYSSHFADSHPDFVSA